MELSKPYVGFK